MTIPLPNTLWKHAIQFGDAPTLDATVCVSTKLKALTNEARRETVAALAGVPGRVSNEVHPTRLELARMSNPRPNLTNVARVLEQTADAPAQPGPIMATARAQAALQRMQRATQPYGGLAQRIHHDAVDSGLDGIDVGECNAQQQTHGFGIRTYRRFPGRKYEGVFFNGQKHGMGYETFGSGAAFEGMFANGVRHGKGVLINANGSRYEGNFENGEKHGYGTLFSADGRKTSEGQFHQGMRQGLGTIFNKDGSKAYEGQFRCGAKHGQGTLFNADGSRYEGQFENHVKQGQGMMFNADGTILYEGEFQADKRHGRGTVFRTDGTVEYEGMLQADKRHGLGTDWSLDGGRLTGTFDKGAPMGSFKYVDPEGKRGEILFEEETGLTFLIDEEGTRTEVLIDDETRAQYERDKEAGGAAA